MSDVQIGILGLLVLLLVFPTGIELGFGMAIVGFVGFSAIVNTHAGTNMLAKDFFDVFSSYGFTVIPLFILMGQVAFNAGIARRLYQAAYRFMGHIPGGLAMATVVGATVFKAICGSSPATAECWTASTACFLPALSTGFCFATGPGKRPVLNPFPNGIYGIQLTLAKVWGMVGSQC